jgi:hypothetical protein
VCTGDLDVLYLSSPKKDLMWAFIKSDYYELRSRHQEFFGDNQEHEYSTFQSDEGR